uniref:Uncharacterized protein n=1 Tax=Ananas comosus var. bracteatus TaxID=296719 RepID=A0A6V7NHD6_ANACO|nr:unnamed protein product [Ananas comosus var. bracteatus]
MSFRSVVRDVRDGFGSISRRSFEVTIAGLASLTGHHRGKAQSSVHELHDPTPVVQHSRWASLPPELLRDVIKRLEASESNWPSRKNVVACAAVCRSWREMCKEIVKNPEFCGKLTFPISLNRSEPSVKLYCFCPNLILPDNLCPDPGSRDAPIQCFIKRDKSKWTYRLYLCLSSAVLDENGKFLLSAKRYRKATRTEYVISMDSGNVSRSSNKYIGKLRSNFIGTKFIIYDTQPHTMVGPPPFARRPAAQAAASPPRKCPPKSLPAATTLPGDLRAERAWHAGPRRMHCIMYSIPASALDPGGSVPDPPPTISARASLRSPSAPPSPSPGPPSATIPATILQARVLRHCRRGERRRRIRRTGKGAAAHPPQQGPRWHEQLQCWCLNFRGRVTVASVKNFQLIAAAQPTPGAPPPLTPPRPPRRRTTTTRSSCSSARSGRTCSRWITGTRCQRSRLLRSA